MSVSFNAIELTRLLRELGTRLEERGRFVELTILGGSALVLGSIADRATKDIDALVSNDGLLRELVMEMANDLGLPTDWLNTAVTPWAPPGAHDFPIDDQLSSGGLLVRVAPARAMFAMKLAAFRPEDRADLRQLARWLEIEKAETAVDLVYQIYGEYASEAGGHGADRQEYLLRATALLASFPESDPDDH